MRRIYGLILFLLASLPLLLTACHSATLEAPIVPRERLFQAEGPRPGACLTEQEAELAQMINQWREKNDLPSIPFSRALYTVAKWHVIDLALFAPHSEKTDSRGLPCDLHSWSDKGEGRGWWEPVCYTPDHMYAKQMWSKPKEIAGYTGGSYENIYWTSAPLSPGMVISFWENRAGEREMILEQKEWKNSKWKAMGVGMYKGFAALWLGDRSYEEDEIQPCMVGNSVSDKSNGADTGQ